MQGTLVVVDMQKEFPASQEERVFRRVQAQIRRAMRYRLGIVILEYEGDFDPSPTDPRIISLLQGYPRWTVRLKDKNDGSGEVVLACRDMRFLTSQLWVCGVNTCACVAATVQGLAIRLPESKIIVVRRACNCWHCDDTEWDHFLRDRNVTIQ